DSVGPLVGRWGAFIWGVRWGLKYAAHSPGGWIVQHVIMKSSRSSLPIMLGKNELNYWEAWRVNEGAVAPFPMVFPNDFPAPFVAALGVEGVNIQDPKLQGFKGTTFIGSNGFRQGCRFVG